MPNIEQQISGLNKIKLSGGEFLNLILLATVGKIRAPYRGSVMFVTLFTMQLLLRIIPQRFLLTLVLLAANLLRGIDYIRGHLNTKY